MACFQLQAITLFLVMLLTGSSAPTQEPDARIRSWQSDLDILSQTIREKHKNAFFQLKRERFDAEVDEIRKKIPMLRDYQIVAEFLKLTALIGDGHTTVQPGNGAVRFRYLPVAFAWMRDGLFITVATPEHRDLLRSRVIAIGHCTMDEAVRRISSLYAYENDSARLDMARRWLNQPEALHAVGIIDDPQKVALTIVDEQGKKRDVTLSPLAGPASSFSNALDGKKDLPPSMHLPRSLYGSTWMEQRKTLYCWYDSCQNDKDKTVAAWCAEVLEQIDKLPVERFVLDMRRNGGGSSMLIQPLISGIRARPQIDQKGKFFVFTGRGTYSSAMQNALDFRERTHAVLMGLPTGGSPNAYGEIKYVDLPYSKWMVQYSTKYYQRGGDGAKTVKPDVEIEPASVEYFAGRDVVLEAAIRFGRS